MTPDTEKHKFGMDSRNMGRVVRAHRKRLGGGQAELAKTIGISQNSLSRIENGLQRIPFDIWISICDHWALPYDCFKTGYIDLQAPLSLKNQSVVGKYKIPARYAKDQGVSVRHLRLFRDYAARTIGERSFDWFLTQRGIDPDYFVHLDHQISRRLFIDIFGFLKDRTSIRREVVSLLSPVGAAAVHGGLAKLYDLAVHDEVSAIRTLVEQSVYYDVDHSYRIDGIGRKRIDVSVEPRRHLAQFDKDSKAQEVGDFGCRYIGGFIEAFSSYRTGRQARMTHEAGNCILHGAERCTYSFRAA